MGIFTYNYYTLKNKMKNKAKKIAKTQGNGVLPCVISRFFKEMAEKHKVKVR